MRSSAYSRKALALLACVVAVMPRAGAAPLELFRESRPAMGTSFEIHLYAASEAEAAAHFEAAFDEIERVEAALSNYRPTSELSRINASAASGPVVTDPEVFAFLRLALDVSRETDGAFDITVGRLIKAWGFFRGRGSYPSDDELARARAETGWRHVLLDPAARTVRFTAPVELDPGAIGKGYAIDRVAALLERSGVRAALVGSGSSSIYALGAPPGMAGWTVRVPDPADRSHALATVVLRDRSISTSGNYEKFFRLGGRTYCHIVDPRTGRPVEGMLQTTVTAASAAESDALATALFVLGAEDGARVLEARPGAGALFVTDRPEPDRVVRLNWR
jgi:thiamine biosynthesis lipoprotein